MSAVVTGCPVATAFGVFEPIPSGRPVRWKTAVMSGTVWWLLTAAAIMAVVDWVAVARGFAVLEYVSKPAATVALLATAVSLDVDHGGSWGWRVAALVFCVFGDVFLMLPRDTFVPGLASFAVGQVMFTVSFLTGEFVGWRLLVGAVLLVPAAAILARRFVSALRSAGRGDLVIPVIAYVVVISAMAVAAIGSGNPVAILGAVVFMISDSLIAESRFVKARSWHPVGIMVTYHFALTGLVLGLL